MAIFRIPVEITGGTLPSPAINVWHARAETLGDIAGVGISPYDGPLGALFDFYTVMKSMIPAGMTITIPSQFTDVDTQEEASADSTIPAITSTGTGSAPPGLAVTVSWKTSIAARRARGRTFVGPLCTAVLQSDGTISEAHLSSVRAACQTLLDDSLAVNGWALGVYGQQSPGLATPKVLRDFTGFKVSDKFAHLRSRRD